MLPAKHPPPTPSPGNVRQVHLHATCHTGLWNLAASFRFLQKSTGSGQPPPACLALPLQLSPPHNSRQCINSSLNAAMDDRQRQASLTHGSRPLEVAIIWASSGECDEAVRRLPPLIKATGCIPASFKRHLCMGKAAAAAAAAAVMQSNLRGSMPSRV